MNLTKFILFVILLVSFSKKSSAEIFYFSYKPILLPINIDFNISKNGINIKSIKVGSDGIKTPIGTFKATSKIYNPETSTQIVFKGLNEMLDQTYVIPQKGKIQVVANQDISILKDESIFTLSNENNIIYFESEKLMGENIKIKIVTGLDSENGDICNRLSFINYICINKDERLKITDLINFSSNSIPISKIDELIFTTDHPLKNRTLIIKDKYNEEFTELTIDRYFNRYDFEEFIDLHVKPLNGEINIKYKKTYNLWKKIGIGLLIIAILFIIGYHEVILEKIGKIFAQSTKEK